MFVRQDSAAGTEHDDDNNNDSSDCDSVAGSSHGESPVAKKDSPSSSQNTAYASGVSEPSPQSDVEMSDQDQSHRSISADTLSLPGLDDSSDDESSARKCKEDWGSYGIML